MACMTHRCVECEWYAFDNDHGPSVCPSCGANVRHDFDELPDHLDRYDDEWADEDDDEPEE